MNKIEELIKQKCPNGVRYVPLNTVCKIYDGTHSTPKYTNQGIRFVSVENIGNLYASEKYISEDDYSKFKITPQLNDIFMTRIGSVGVCTVVDRDEPLAYYVSLALLRPNPQKLNSYFLKYAIECFEGQQELYKRTLVNAVPIKVNKDDIGKILVPIPPLDIQQEIVNILDKFTGLYIELQAELEARKKQYEFYRDELLKFDENVVYRSLETLCDIVDYRGKTPQKVDSGVFLVTTKNIRKGYIDYESSQEFINEEDYSDVMRRGLPQIGDVLFTTEAPCGNVAQIDREEIALAQRVIKYRPKKDSKLNSTFLKYVLLGNEFQNKLMAKSTGGTVKGIKGSVLHTLTVPVPTIEEQICIVTILDKFNEICNDCTVGLPAEIAIRKKQYEYYRDKLLTFERKVV